MIVSHLFERIKSRVLAGNLIPTKGMKSVAHLLDEYKISAFYTGIVYTIIVYEEHYL